MKARSYAFQFLNKYQFTICLAAVALLLGPSSCARSPVGQTTQTNGLAYLAPPEPLSVPRPSPTPLPLPALPDWEKTPPAAPRVPRLPAQPDITHTLTKVTELTYILRIRVPREYYLDENDNRAAKAMADILTRATKQLAAKFSDQVPRGRTASVDFMLLNAVPRENDWLITYGLMVNLPAGNFNHKIGMSSR